MGVDAAGAIVVGGLAGTGCVVTAGVGLGCEGAAGGREGVLPSSASETSMAAFISPSGPPPPPDEALAGAGVLDVLRS